MTLLPILIRRWLRFRVRTSVSTSLSARWAATSTDGMTAEAYPFKLDFLNRVASRIVNGVSGINRVVYDVTSKPPGTIEWE